MSVRALKVVEGIYRCAYSFLRLPQGEDQEPALSDSRTGEGNLLQIALEYVPVRKKEG
jgi:hypothetical protein